MLPSLTSPLMKNMMTSEQPSQGSALCAPSLQTPALHTPSAPCPTPPSSPIIPKGLIVLPWRQERKLHTSYGSASIHQQNLPAQPSSGPKQQPQGTTGTTPERQRALCLGGEQQQSLGHFLAGHVEGLGWMIPGALSSSCVSGALVA